MSTEQRYEPVADRYVQLADIKVYTSDEVNNLLRLVHTENTYLQDNLQIWLINRLNNSIVSHQQGTGVVSSYYDVSFSPDSSKTVVRGSEFRYLANGLLEYEITEPQGDEQSYLKTSYSYDPVGNIKTKTLSSKAGVADAYKIDRSTENVYDNTSAGRYVTAKKVNGVEVASYSDFTALGQAQTVTENGIRTLLRYNAFGQPVFSREQTPGGAVSGRYNIITRGYTPSAVGLPGVGVTGYSYERVQQGGAPSQWKVADAAGRELATITEAFQSGRYVIKRTEYDVLGRPLSVSQPAFDGDALSWNSSSYDIFGRPKQLNAADGTLTDISYQGLNTISEISNFWAGAQAQSKTEIKDAFGQLRSVSDAAGTLNYEYDATGNLLSVTGVDAKVMLMSYNSRGHKQSMQDPDSGSWVYKYNALGELVEQTNPKNHITTTWYDDFGRKTQEKITHGSATLRDTQWGYSDEVGHAVRNLIVSESVTNGPIRLFDYDNLGRLERSELHIDGEVLLERTTYDQYSRVFQVFDASGEDFGVQYQYSGGYQRAVWEARYGIGNANSVRYQLISALDAFGNVTESRAGNNRTTWRNHDNVTGMLKAITTQGGLQDWSYEFDGLGNLRSRSDSTHKLPAVTGSGVVNFSESFDYDNLNRVETVYNNGVVTQSLSYFANGNIKTKSDVQSGATYQYGSKPAQCSRNSGPRAVSQIGTTSYCYDIAGNQTHQYNNGALVRQVDYDVTGKASRIRSFSTDTASGSSPGDSFFTYDGSRKLVKRHVTEQGSTKTYYQHGGVELIKEGSSTTMRRNIGNALVERNGNMVTTRYVYTDHLGSVDVITDGAGLIEQKLSFDAFGKRRQVVTAAHQPVALSLSAILNLTNRGFTGHLQVDHASIVHMGGRIYDAHLGRFLQADPFVQAPSDSQNHNRYSYVLNNPLSYTDPSGYFFSKLWKEIKPFIGVIVAVVGTIVCPACGPVLIGALAGAANAAVNGGNILQGAVMGAFSGMMFGVVGETWAAGTFGNVLGNAAVGGWMNSIQGGKFGHGFFAAGFSAAFKPGINKIGNGAASHAAHRIVAAAIVGGTASKISGGKFANGAVTGAFSQAFNGEKSLRKNESRTQKVLKMIDIASKGNDTLTIYSAGEDIYNAAKNANFNSELMNAASSMTDEQLKVFFPEYFDKYGHVSVVKYHLMQDYGNYYKDAFLLGHSMVSAGVDVGTIVLTGGLPASLARTLFLLELTQIDYDFE